MSVAESPAPQPFADPSDLVAAAAESLNTTIAELQADRTRTVHLGLTGGTIATELYRLWPHSPGVDRVDWSRVALWWGDERHVPADSRDRNAEPALALLADLPFGAIHVMPADEGAPLAEAAERYAEEFADTRLDICLLGMGPDGHVASIFPGHQSMTAGAERVISEANSPKPPPERISLTLPAINDSTEVWFLVSGAGKREALAGALAGEAELPAGRARGRERTRWFCDEAAAPGPSR